MSKKYKNIGISTFTFYNKKKLMIAIYKLCKFKFDLVFFWDKLWEINILKSKKCKTYKILKINYTYIYKEITR